MFPQTVELAFRSFQQHQDPRALAIVFDRTATDLLALGRHLATPGTDAEDLVQATFVTAIEDAASHRAGERVLPWLVGILNNHARAARRRARRVPDADRLPNAISDTGADVQAAELQAELRAAIDRLPEAYRPVLRLVFEHGLAANEIARTLERPAGTVRAQVTRGIELLRRHLPASLAGSAAVMASTGRGLAAVRTAVLGKCGGTSTGFVAILSLGGLLVLHHKITAALAAALFVALGCLWLDREPATAVRAAIQPRDAAVIVTTSVDDPVAAPDRSAVIATPATTPSARAEVPPSNAVSSGVLVVRLRDGSGAPLPGIGVAVHPIEELQNLGRDLAHRPTDARGEVAFATLAPGQWAIDVDRIGTALVAEAVAGTTTEHVVTLPAGVRTRGSVHDRAGNPVPGATIVLHGSRASMVPIAVTDALGAFTADHLAAGSELQARARRREPSLAHTVRGADGGDATVALVVGDAAHTVTGRVLAPDGTPVPDAVVALLPAAAATFDPTAMERPQVRATWLRTEADGTFRCDEVSAAPQLVFATAQAHGLAPAWTEVDATRGDAFVELRLPHGATLEGTVTNGGQPAAGLQVTAWQGDGLRIGYLANLLGIRYAEVARDGAFQLAGLLPGTSSVRLVQGTSVLRDETLAFRDGETTTWNTDLAATTGLTITVRRAEPLGQQRLVAIVTKSTPQNGNMPSLVPIQADGKGVHTAARSEPVDVVLTCMPGGSSLVQLAAHRNVPPSQSAVTFELQPQQVPVRSIRGRLTDAQNAPVAGTTIAATKASADGLFVRLETTTGRDGTFALGPLPAGDYTLLAGPLRTAQPIGNVVLTNDRDESAGDLRAPAR